jgi:DNA-binding beta-propeller fold protein YncE
MRKSILIKLQMIQLISVVVFVISTMGVSTSVSAAEPNDSVVFYPPLPGDPRLQYLTKFSSSQDVSAKNKKMRDFVFGGEEFEGHAVTKPYGVGIYEGAIYAVDTEQQGYVVFDVARGQTRLVQGSQGGGMPKPINITFDKDGTRYVTDTQRDAVIVFDRNDRFVRALGKPGQLKPIDVAIVGDRLYVTDIKNMTVKVLDKVTGEVLFEFGGPGAGQGKLLHPTSLSLGPDETLYVTDTGNFRIQHFTLDGEFIRTIGQLGVGPGSFVRPKGVAVDRDGRIYVVDSGFENVQVLDTDGTPLTVFGGEGMGPGNINMPTAIKIDYDNVEYFRKYAAPGFEVEYLVLVASQFGVNKIAIFGFGSLNEEFVDASEGSQ